MIFLLSYSTFQYNLSFAQMCWLILTGFSGEQCGPWETVTSIPMASSFNHPGCIPKRSQVKMGLLFYTVLKSICSDDYSTAMTLWNLGFCSLIWRNASVIICFCDKKGYWAIGLFIELWQLIMFLFISLEPMF